MPDCLIAWPPPTFFHLFRQPFNRSFDIWPHDPCQNSHTVTPISCTITPVLWWGDNSLRSLFLDVLNSGNSGCSRSITAEYMGTQVFNNFVFNLSIFSIWKKFIARLECAITIANQTSVHQERTSKIDSVKRNLKCSGFKSFTIKLHSISICLH